LHDHIVHTLKLFVRVGVSDYCPVYLDVVVITKFRNFSLVNWVSLSVMIELGTPKQKAMSGTKLTTCLEPILSMGLASIHLENLSTMTSRWVKPPGTFWKGPKRYRAHTTKGHVIGMVWNYWATAWTYLAKH
jgi:hypothetical protein